MGKKAKASAKAPPKLAAIVTHRLQGKGAITDREQKWKSGQLFLPSLTDAAIIQRGDRVLLDGILWKDAAGPMMTGPVSALIHQVDSAANFLEVLVQIVGAQMSHTVDLLSSLADPHGNPMIFTLHFCQPKMCSEIAASDFRFHLNGIKLSLDPVKWNQMTPIGVHLPPPAGAGSENVTSHLQSLAQELGFKVNANEGQGFPPLPRIMDAPSTLTIPASVAAPRTQLSVEAITDRKSLAAALQAKMSPTAPRPAQDSMVPVTLGGSSSSNPEGMSKSRKKKKKHKKRKREKKRQHSSSSEDSSSSETSSSSLGDPRTKFRRIAEQRPGQLFLAGLKEVTRLLEGQMGLVETQGVMLKPVFIKYYQLVMRNVNLGARGHREALTLATIMDQIVAGQPMSALDVAMQRLKAIESTAGAHPSLPWAVASHLEVITTERPGTLSAKEQLAAAKQQSRDVKLQRLLTSVTDRKGGSTLPAKGNDKPEVKSYPQDHRGSQQRQSNRRVSFRSPLREDPPVKEVTK
jgi:hypothetical protein